jgi:hypothetical protein
MNMRAMHGLTKARKENRLTIAQDIHPCAA